MVRACECVCVWVGIVRERKRSRGKVTEGRAQGGSVPEARTDRWDAERQVKKRERHSDRETGNQSVGSHSRFISLDRQFTQQPLLPARRELCRLDRRSESAESSTQEFMGFSEV
ncbi:hypothetical protein AOLI_G00048010 [Acnodon oligacanthus]